MGGKWIGEMGNQKGANLGGGGRGRPCNFNWQFWWPGVVATLGGRGRGRVRDFGKEGGAPAGGGMLKQEVGKRGDMG